MARVGSSPTSRTIKKDQLSKLVFFLSIALAMVSHHGIAVDLITALVRCISSARSAG